MKNPIKNLVLLSGAALLSVSNLSAVETDPVGFTTATVAGTGGVGSEAFNFIAFPFVKAPSVAGASSTIGTSTLADASKTWTVDEFAGFFVEVTSGTAAGTATTIVSNTADELTLADDLSLLGLVATDTYAIRAYTTLGEIFGADDAAVAATGVQVGTSLAAADEILIPNGVGGYDFYFYNSNAAPILNGWRKSTAPTTDASSTPIVPGQGFIYKRKATGDFDLVSTGTVQTQLDMLNGIGTGFNFISSNYPTDATLESFFGADPTLSGWTGATTLGAADKVLVPDGSGGYTFYFYNTNAAPILNGWRSSTAPTTDASATVIASPGQSFIVERLGADINWTEDRPFTL